MKGCWTGWCFSNHEYPPKLLAPHIVSKRCQELGEEWVKSGKAREIPGGGSVEEYKEVNRKESVDLADAFLSTK